MKKDVPPLAVGYFRLARKVSYNSVFKIKIGAALSKKNKLVSRGYNKIKSHPIYANPEKHTKISIHAEIDCILKGVGDTIYVYREYKNGQPAMAKPCEVCMKTLRLAGVKKVFYSVPEWPYYRMETL